MTALRTVNAGAGTERAARARAPQERGPRRSSPAGKALARTGSKLTDLDVAAERARAYAADARSPNTVKTYKAQWKKFAEWCAERRVKPMPARGELVAAYLAHLADKGKKLATIEVALAAISEAHKLAGFASPRESAALRETVKGIRRRIGMVQKGKAPLHGDAFVKALRTIPENTLRGLRERALLLLGFAGGFRRSELVAICVEDLNRNDVGFAVLLRRSKTDQKGKGRLVPIPRDAEVEFCPVQAVDAWLRAANITSGPIFRAVHRSGSVSSRGLAPGGNHVAAVVKDAVEDAGLASAEYSGHSLRAGLVTAAAKAGRSTRSIKKTTGHRSDSTVERYVRGLGLMEDIAASGLLSGNGGGAWRGR